MKKTLLAAAIALATASVVTPKYVATQFDAELESAFKKINDSGSVILTIEKKDIGWFSSSVDATFAINAELFEADPEMKASFESMKLAQGIPFNIAAKHGPFLFTDQASLGGLQAVMTVAADVIPEKVEFDRTQPFFKSVYTVDFNGSVVFEEAMQAISFTEDEGQFVLHAYKGKGTSSANGTEYKGGTAGIEMVTDDMTIFEAKNLGISTSMKEDFFSVLGQPAFNGDAKITLESFKLADAIMDGQKFDLQGFSIGVGSAYESSDDLASILVNYHFDQVNIAEIDMSDMNIDLSLKNIKMQAMNELQQFSTQLQSGALDPDLEEKVKSLLLDLVSHAPEFGFTNISTTFPEGKMNLDMNVAVQPFDSFPEPGANPAEFSKNFSGVANAFVDHGAALHIAEMSLTRQLRQNPDMQSMSDDEFNAIVKQHAPGMLQTFEQQGLMTKTEKGYEFHASFKDGVATLNGNPVPLPWM